MSFQNCECCGAEIIDVEEYRHRCGDVTCWECLDDELCPDCANPPIIRTRKIKEDIWTQTNEN